jgi:hypothetical protein
MIRAGILGFITLCSLAVVERLFFMSLQQTLHMKNDGVAGIDPTWHRLCESLLVPGLEVTDAHQAWWEFGRFRE